MAGNLLTHALLEAPGVEGGLTKLLAAALVANFATLGVGSIAAVAAVVVLLLLVVSKIVISTVLALLFVSGGLAIALWPLPETSWVARTWLQALFGVLLWPVVWALCFALFAVLGQSAFSFKGEFGDELVKPFVTVATLWVAFKAPQLLARQAMLAGIAPSLGSGLARTMVYGRGALGAGAASGRERRRRGRQRPLRRPRERPGAAARAAGGLSVANPTYKHLEGKTVVGQFSLGQWAQLLAGVLLGLGFGIYLSPLPPTPTIFIACLLPGLPLAASYGAMGLEFSLVQLARAAWRFWRAPRRWLPGPAPRRPATSSFRNPIRTGSRRRGPNLRRARRLEGLWDL